MDYIIVQFCCRSCVVINHSHAMLSFSSKWVTLAHGVLILIASILPHTHFTNINKTNQKILNSNFRWNRSRIIVQVLCNYDIYFTTILYVYTFVSTHNKNTKHSSIVPSIWLSLQCECVYLVLNQNVLFLSVLFMCSVLFYLTQIDNLYIR